MNWIEFVWFKDKWRNAILGLGTANIFLFDLITASAKKDDCIQKQFLWAYKGALGGTYLIVMGVYFNWIHYPYQTLWILNGSIGFVTLLILVNAIRHKIIE